MLTGTLLIIALLFDIWVWFHAQNLVLMENVYKPPAQEIAQTEEQDAKQLEELPIRGLKFRSAEFAAIT